MSKIDRIGFQSQNWVPDRLFKKQIALFYFCYGHMLYSNAANVVVG